MPGERALVEAASELVRSNPFSEAHDRAVVAMGHPAPDGPVWVDRAVRIALAEELEPTVRRIRARRHRASVRASGVACDELLDGLAAAWLGVAAPEDQSALALDWFGGTAPLDATMVASIRGARVALVESIARDWPGSSPAARAFRAALWRAAWLQDAFVDVRQLTWAPPVPVVIRGGPGAPRVRVAGLLACADPWEAVDEPPRMWRCRLPSTDAALRIREPGPGLRFIDRIETASVDVQSALVEQLGAGSPGSRWIFGVEDATTLETLDPELRLAIAGIQLEIPPLPALLEGDGLVAYVERTLANADVPDAAGRAEGIADWLEQKLGRVYDWPGHLAELSRYVRARLVGCDIEPPPATRDVPATFWAGVAEGELDADTLLSRYCTWVYALTGSYVATASRLGIDRRTVRKRVDTKLLPTFREP